MKLLRNVAIVVVVLLAYPAWLGYNIVEQSHDDELPAGGADAIVVLGAAQYDGDPSPVFRARLDHAAYLYNERFSDTLIVTGGKQQGDRFTEAEAGERYLASRDISPDDILGESKGATTLESLELVKEIFEREGMDSVLLVSDPLHSERLKRIAEDLGFEEAFTSPASYVELNRSRATKLRELVHEITALLAYEVAGR